MWVLLIMKFRKLAVSVSCQLLDHKLNFCFISEFIKLIFFLRLVARVNSILPDINHLMTNLKNTQVKLKEKGDDVDKKIDRLKRQVAEARDLASRVNVGVSFQPNTFVEVKNPEDLAKQSISTKVSAYFKSDKPNGALLYLGNEMGTSRKLKRAHTVSYFSLIR